MWQQRAQLLPTLSARRANVCTCKQHAKILLQSEVDRALQRNRHNAGDGLGGDAARERIRCLRSGEAPALCDRCRGPGEPDRCHQEHAT